jgi:DDE_Tnp_1-associated
VPALSVLPIVAALDHAEVELDEVIAAPGSSLVSVPVRLSLVEALSEVPDPRKARGVRHGVLAVLLLGACAALTGARSFAAVAEYAHWVVRAQELADSRPHNGRLTKRSPASRRLQSKHGFETATGDARRRRGMWTYLL